MKRVIYANQYTYNGRPFRTNSDTPLPFMELTTYANSEAKAASNFKYQIRKQCGLPRTENITLDESDITFIDLDYYNRNYYDETWDIDEPISSENKTCEICGTPLTDGGYCPVCDDGEKDYF